MKIVITEEQVKNLILLIKEDYSVDFESNDTKIVDDFKHTLYLFDYMPEDLKLHFKKTENTMYNFTNIMMYTMKFLSSKYDLSRVVVKDKGEIVGFLIYSYTNKDKEEIETDEISEDNYPVLLATAVKPEYRERGLLKLMINNAKIDKPFLVQTSQISTPQVWEKIGCKVLYDLSDKYGEGNKIELCK